MSRSQEPEGADSPQTSRNFPGAQFDVVALASSAGGIAAISHILESLPAGFPAAQLVSLAWASPELSSEQLRTYVVRLRRHLATTGVPARLVSEPRRGYGLVFTA